MTNKQVTGLVLVVVGVGALTYLYKGYFKAKKEAESEFNNLTKKLKESGKIS